MKILSIPIRPLARLWLGLIYCLVSAGTSRGQLLLTNVQAVNVTPSGFSLIGTVSPAINSTSNVTVSIFADPGGATNLAGQVGIEFYPLNSGNPAATNSYGLLLSTKSIQQDTMNLGLIYTRISYCTPNTTYYYQIAVTNTNGQSVVWPPSGPLPSTTTALENSFVLQSQQLLVTLNDPSPPGSIITLSTSNSSSVLAAVVGDGTGTNQAFFSINDLIAAAGGTNYSPVGDQLFTASVLGSNSTGLTQTYDLIFSNSFSVGQVGSVSLGSLSTMIAIGTDAILTGSAGFVPITLEAQGPLVGLSFVLNIPTNLFSAISLEPITPALGAAVLTMLSSNTVQLSFTAATGQNLQGSQEIAQLNFTAESNQASAFVPLSPQELQATNANAGVSNVFLVEPGRAIIIGPQPLLDIQVVAGSLNLVLYGNPGQSYQIQTLTNLAESGSWSNFVRVPMTNLMQIIPNLNASSITAFFRAYVLNADPPILQASFSGTNQSLLAFGLAGTNYTLQTSSNLSATVAWHPLLNYTLTNSFQFFTNPGASQPVFYRIKKH